MSSVAAAPAMNAAMTASVAVLKAAQEMGANAAALVAVAAAGAEGRAALPYSQMLDKLA
ncbi:MAG: hypothetical protein J0L51_13240 [Rhizobiales bacterium]|nr:hypothetical protein [Hyphomicrobiales bacterium]